ncbi:MAG: TrmJ/YjtD family RNA methyltransferase, partial [bacterium]|nr:TrmJ/YjtD family RNA methyltransferase [bacterium]
MDIILQESKNAGNIGAVARAMKNFELCNLVLLNPKCNHLDKEALDRATHAKDILQKTKIIKKLDYDTLIGTTAIIGTDYNLNRTPITPETLAKMHIKGKVGLLFGREDHGLNNEELEKCDIIVTIPSSKKYPTMNVSQAAVILLYEFFKHSKRLKTGENIKPATKEQKEILLKLIEDKTKKMAFSAEYKKETQKRVWKKVIGKSNL